MAEFDKASQDRLATCDERLQLVFVEVVKFWPCRVLEGKRTMEQQRANMARGVSKTLQSKHVFPISAPSLAVDVAPNPLQWPRPPKAEAEYQSRKEYIWALQRWMKDYGRFYYFSGFVLGIAQGLGIRLRHGGDWDGDRDITDQDFDDLVHFELKEA